MARPRRSGRSRAVETLCADVRRFLWLINADEVLGTHKSRMTSNRSAQALSQSSRKFKKSGLRLGGQKSKTCDHFTRIRGARPAARGLSCADHGTSHPVGKGLEESRVTGWHAVIRTPRCCFHLCASNSDRPIERMLRRCEIRTQSGPNANPVSDGDLP
jgi:hypothetical protein